jgi:hypothetical protein
MLDMTTGRPLWSHIFNPLTIMYYVGCIEELLVDIGFPREMLLERSKKG